ncbi:AAEL000165-PB [Aedes aegypti]|uniref:AAEL000165-PB n=2 Tax=Aedes aegypti TaxID=7159 RepID=A0A1S4EV38_AEDAE|nr:uncharacterized protein LOC5570039 isoform X1 [Aedes aegypti]EAT48820.1 AAEL000165-PB [Aedes aegypti]
MRSICLIIVCGFIISCQGYTAIFPNSENKDFPGECYDTETKIHFKPGENRQRPGMCEEMSCGTDFSIHFFGCGLAILDDDPDCEPIVQDFTKDYPQCCHKYKCVRNGEVNYI